MEFKYEVEEDDDQLERDTDEKLTKSIDLLAKRFGKVMRILDKRLRNYVTNNVNDDLPQNTKDFNTQCKGKDGGKNNANGSMS